MLNEKGLPQSFSPSCIKEQISKLLGTMPLPDEDYQVSVLINNGTCAFISDIRPLTPHSSPFANNAKTFTPPNHHNPTSILNLWLSSFSKGRE